MRCIGLIIYILALTYSNFNQTKYDFGSKCHGLWEIPLTAVDVGRVLGRDALSVARLGVRELQGGLFAPGIHGLNHGDQVNRTVVALGAVGGPRVGGARLRAGGWAAVGSGRWGPWPGCGVGCRGRTDRSGASSRRRVTYPFSAASTHVSSLSHDFPFAIFHVFLSSSTSCDCFHTYIIYIIIIFKFKEAYL